MFTRSQVPSTKHSRSRRRSAGPPRTSQNRRATRFPSSSSRRGRSGWPPRHPEGHADRGYGDDGHRGPLVRNDCCQKDGSLSQVISISSKGAVADALTAFDSPLIWLPSGTGSSRVISTTVVIRAGPSRGRSLGIHAIALAIPQWMAPLQSLPRLHTDGSRDHDDVRVLRVLVITGIEACPLNANRAGPPTRRPEERDRHHSKRAWFPNVFHRHLVRRQSHRRSRQRGRSLNAGSRFRD